MSHRSISNQQYRRRTQKSRKTRRAALARRENNFCFWCYDYIPTTRGVADHVVPRRYGGPDTLDNQVFSCDPCDQRRSHNIYSDIELELLRLMMKIYLTNAHPGWLEKYKDGVPRVQSPKPR